MTRMRNQFCKNWQLEREAEPHTIKFGGGCDALAAEALGMLCEVEKDRILMQMLERIRQLVRVAQTSPSSSSRTERECTRIR